MHCLCKFFPGGHLTGYLETLKRPVINQMLLWAFKTLKLTL